MRPTIYIMLLISFIQIQAQTSHNINVAIEQEGACETLNIQNQNSSNVSVYPNPVNASLFIKSPNIIQEIEIYNILGQKTHNYNVEGNATSIDVSDIKDGIYLLIIKTPSSSYNHKIIVSHD